jgi:hypothetical protein
MSRTNAWHRTLTVVIAALLLMVNVACDGGGKETAPTTKAPTTTTEPQPFTRAAFAVLRDVPMRTKPVYAGPAAPGSLDGVLVAPSEEGVAGDPAVAGPLLDHGFVVVPSDYRLFQQPYSAALYEDGTPVFVTTDVAYHLVHLAFSKVLRTTEERTLLPVLETLLADLDAATAAQRTELAGTDLADASARAEQLVEAAAELAEVDVGELGPLAAKEVALARAADQVTASPILGFGPCDPTQSPEGCVNYALLRPRGHYTRSADLERWFRSMALLGVLGASLDQPNAMQVQLLVARAIASDPSLRDRWTRIYEPTAFMVGAADDYTPLELAAVADTLIPGWADDPARLADIDAMRKLAEGLRARREVLIDPEAASVRVMGVRFVIDAYALDQLAWPNVGDPPVDQRRVKVSALDVAASMGSPLAEQLQREAGQFEYTNYGSQLKAMQDLFAERSQRDWAATVYDAWLWALMPQWSSKGEPYPPVMRTAEWEAKSLQTGLASYAELKHDTILYAKQGFAAEGEVQRPFEPRHWVEPDPVAFGRLDAVVDLLADGLSERGLLTDESRTLLTELSGVLERLQRLAEEELGGRAISDDDNAWLETIGSTIEAFWLRTADTDPATLQPSSSDQDAAVIADIFTTTFEALEVATGRIDTIYVLVPNDEGRFELAQGGVYSSYEFWQPAAQRLTDEEWRAMLDGGTQPERPAWQDSFLAQP